MTARYSKEFQAPIKLSVLMPVYNERFLVEAAIHRVLAFSHPQVREVELIVVDDGSTDGTRDILRRLAGSHRSMRYFEQERNQGKGAAIRRAIAEASGELAVIQDADLEYYPEDWGRLLRPFFEADADAVYGSRFMSGEYRKVLYFWHTLGNQFLTFLSNAMTDLNLTDMETCYKMVRTELLKSIPIRSNDFSIEPELTAKLAKRAAVIYEVPIRYAGRTYQEGKKISARHGFGALWSILKWTVVDDLFQNDQYGAAILTSLSQVHQFNRWMSELLSPELGARVLEIGAGVGNLTMRFLPREHYLATDINPHYLAFLHNMSVGKPYLRVAELDVTDAQAFAALQGRFDTVICLNVLEHVEDVAAALRNIYSALEPGGKAILLVPQGQWLYCSLDDALGHTRRFGRSEVDGLIRGAGFEIEQVFDYNKVSVLGWLYNGRVWRRKHFPRIQLKALNMIAPVVRHVDNRLPWHGLSVVAVARKPKQATAAVRVQA
ncbi:MAG: glycosyltransferase [Deltaproteobacteria bacterium]|nr:glycosyltransferase [Deltaproteobacteria bacterium]